MNTQSVLVLAVGYVRPQRGSSNYMEIEQSRRRKGAKGWKWNNEDSEGTKGLRKA